MTYRWASRWGYILSFELSYSTCSTLVRIHCSVSRAKDLVFKSVSTIGSGCKYYCSKSNTRSCSFSGY